MSECASVRRGHKVPEKNRAIFKVQFTSDRENLPIMRATGL